MIQVELKFGCNLYITGIASSINFVKSLDRIDQYYSYFKHEINRTADIFEKDLSGRSSFSFGYLDIPGINISKKTQANL